MVTPAKPRRGLSANLDAALTTAQNAASRGGAPSTTRPATPAPAK